MIYPNCPSGVSFYRPQISQIGTIETNKNKKEPGSAPLLTLKTFHKKKKKKKGGQVHAKHKCMNFIDNFDPFINGGRF